MRSSLNLIPEACLKRVKKTTTILNKSTKSLLKAFNIYMSISHNFANIESVACGIVYDLAF